MILLVANSRDFATDYVVSELRRRCVDYFRLDMDLFHLDGMLLDPVAGRLRVRRDGSERAFGVRDVDAVLYRAPTHLSESGGLRRAPEQRLADHQWAAFVRSLVVFRTAHWINHPQQTYLAENKPYQLALASALGFRVAPTLVTNEPPEATHAVWEGGERCAVKALDTFVLASGESDLFFYTQTVERDALGASSLQSMPVLFQRLLAPKTDLRVTVIGERVFAVEILVNGRGVEGDWRLQKLGTEYKPIDLPEQLASACVELVRELGLAFGAIDLVRVGSEYFFLEINPTGEWAWLVDAAGLPLDRAMADELCRRAPV